MNVERKIMPAWLLQDENYLAQSDKDTYINRSILSLLSVLAKIRRQDGQQTRQFYGHPALKIAVTLLLITLLSLSKSFAFVIMVKK